MVFPWEGWVEGLPACVHLAPPCSSSWLCLERGARLAGAHGNRNSWWRPVWLLWRNSVLPRPGFRPWLVSEEPAGAFFLVGLVGVERRLVILLPCYPPSLPAELLEGGSWFCWGPTWEPEGQLCSDDFLSRGCVSQVTH